MANDVVSQFQKSRKSVFARDFYTLRQKQGYSSNKPEITITESGSNIDVSVNLQYVVDSNSIKIIDGNNYLIITGKECAGNKYLKIIDVPRHEGISNWEIKGDKLVVVMQKNKNV